MKNIEFQYLDRSTEAYNRLLSLLKALDQSYIPRISLVVSLPEYARKLVQSAEVLVACHGNTDIGLIALYVNDSIRRCAFISSIGVRVDFQGKGVGAALMTHAIEIAVKRGMERIRLEVDVENHVARKFYRQAGFFMKASNYKPDGRMMLILERSLLDG